ncbi:hypothetical protein Scep_009756 [Stephania cephalantha]|uniref:Uncharacterized protein n=1 Tax=Stephania cephalantha TaxID=152367 RepID=A0AAP0JUS9_9MAGN
MTTSAWKQLFTRVRIHNLVAPSSDHMALLMEVSYWQELRTGVLFELKNSWLREEGCSEVIKKSWDSNGFLSIMDQIQECGTKLKRWSKSTT